MSMSISTDDKLVAARCENGSKSIGNYTNYLQNLEYVLAHINTTDYASKEDDNHGFMNATYSNDGGDTVYSLAQCRGDVKGENCSKCLSNIASINMSFICPGGNTKGAVVLREKCFFKYSDQDFFGKLDASLDQTYFPYCSFEKRTSAGDDLVKSLLDSLVKSSINATSMFAKGSNKTSDGSSVVEAMAECRGDLNLDDCKNCLSDANTSSLSSNCSEKSAGKYFMASCNLRFAWNGSTIY